MPIFDSTFSLHGPVTLVVIQHDETKGEAMRFKLRTLIGCVTVVALLLAMADNYFAKETRGYRTISVAGINNGTDEVVQVLHGLIDKTNVATAINKYPRGGVELWYPVPKEQFSTSSSFPVGVPFTGKKSLFGRTLEYRELFDTVLFRISYPSRSSTFRAAVIPEPKSNSKIELQLEP